ncbi:hypothetical protein [Lactiplantibacillus plantarum]|uniref:hypothetical protein n=1 Tax=Lactiplantibacillus plantarum TaxID=1590 RepID=UPI000976FFE1|nr:hypothetical protein [Lactiplantibacillus plantarum]
MNEYTQRFKKAALEIHILAYSRESNPMDVTEYAKRPLKYAFLEEQQKMENDYLSNKIQDSIEYYNMQAALYRYYLKQLHLDPTLIVNSYNRRIQKKRDHLRDRFQ